MSERLSSRKVFLRFINSYKLGQSSESGKSKPLLSAGSLARDKLREDFLNYVRWLWPWRHAVAIVLIFALLAAGLQMIEPLFIRFIIDRVLLNKELDSAARLVRVHTISAFFFAVIVSANLIGSYRNYRQRLLTARITLSLRRALFERLLHLPLTKLWDMKVGGILAKLTGDVDTTAGILQMALISPAISVVQIMIAVVVLFTVSWQLALIALVIIPLTILGGYIFTRRVQPIHRSLRKDAEQISGRAGETFAGIRVVRAFGRELRELRDYLSGCHVALRKDLFAQRRELLLWTSWGFLMAGVNVVIFWYGGELNIAGSATIGDIMAVQWYTFMLLNPIWNIVNSFSELHRSLAATKQVFEVLAIPPDKPDRPTSCDAPSIVHQLSFENVSFEYTEGKPVVSNFNVEVSGGSIVALVGRSGAGKTTITDLVARFHDPTQGRIRVNGSDIRDFRLSSYRDLLAIVQQDVFLFDGSIADNISYGRRNATNASIENAAKLANAHEFILRQPERYETIIGERGVKLSGGQQQRLAIARAILASAQILILDEATSNLDTESEQLIQESLTNLLAGKTTFVIAHRLSTVRRADLILMLDDGKIIERGTHKQLMNLGGNYSRMVLKQMDSSAYLQ